MRDLNRAGRPREVHAALIGYLENHSKLAEPWMYEVLAAAIELNQGPAGDVKKALYYAADLAQRTHNPNHLVSAADQLLIRGYLDRVGALLDEAMPLVPHRYEPMRDVDQSGSENAGSQENGRRGRELALARLARSGRVFPPSSRQPGRNLGQVSARGW